MYSKIKGYEMLKKLFSIIYSLYHMYIHTLFSKKKKFSEIFLIVVLLLESSIIIKN